MELPLPEAILRGEIHSIELRSPIEETTCAIDYACGEDILFHISLRPAEEVAVLNDRIGGRWGEEIRAPLSRETLGRLKHIRIRFEERTHVDFGEIRAEFPRDHGLAQVNRLACSHPFAFQRSKNPEASLTPARLPIRPGDHHFLILPATSQQGYVNYSSRDAILLHLSFRPEESVLVVNDQPEGQWRDEVRIPLPSIPQPIEVTFAQYAARVSAGGEPVILSRGLELTTIDAISGDGLIKVLARQAPGTPDSPATPPGQPARNGNQGLLPASPTAEEAAISAATAAVPYRQSPLPACGRLLELNRTLWSDGKNCPASWLLKQVQLAIRFECFETASEAVELLASSPMLGNAEFKGEYLRAYTEVALAEGRIQGLRALLLREIELAEQDDDLWTALSLCFPPSPALLPEFGTLPSGKPNRFLVSRVDQAGATLDLARRLARTPAECSVDHLLLASLCRKLDGNLYREHWNRFLAAFHLTPIASLETSASNVLGSFAFPQPAPGEGTESVSVILPVFNAESTMDYAIQSVLNQSHPAIELLICDDCSSDRSLAKLLEWRKDPRVRIFRSQANQGPYNIRNALLAKASGEYVTFQDADDLSHPQRIERQLAALRQSGTDAVHGRWVRLRPDGEVVFFRDHQCVRMCAVSLLARKSLFTELGGYRRVLCAGDTEFLERLRLWRGPGGIHELAEPLVLGLWSERSLTRQTGLEVTEEGYRAPARRRYAEIAARQRLLGREIVPDEAVDAAVKEAGIFRPFAGVMEL